ncbi:Isoprenyl transferase [Pirellula sp. SH-Sr6A]|uniref:isoprenyl transferase n=1 Tax=Pirellula sp. SH-Sr6A TaxID=1632865 RepID=UPI00078EF59E|nr:isoprenyl transferase [Pirellula sp. SH-Sr6A]AMV32025.1 Isoprenyl transferase [Pirellula sp. SH-Sr6A]
MSFFRRKKPSTTTELVIPKHVAIIMDGNGRWAQARGLPRIEGHRQGAQSVRRACEVCVELGVQVLTLYCFSSENWKRPKEELDFLMGLLKQFLIQESKTLVEKNIRLSVIGRRDGLPEDVLDEMDRAIAKSAHLTGLHLCLAINYGSRQEITDAVRAIAQKVHEGACTPDQIDESTISKHLYTADLPDPDLLIRTSGELRLSNYLLWQISYSELWITKRAWPEFSRHDFLDAIEDYSKRHRRFGGL